MYHSMQELMQRRADLLVQGRCDELAAEYLFPLVLYLDDSRLVVATAAELARIFEVLCQDRKARGVHRVTAEVTAMDLPRNGRLRLWVTYREEGANGWPLGHSAVVQYCRQTAQGLRTEMAEISRCAATLVWPQQQGRTATIL